MPYQTILNASISIGIGAIIIGLVKYIFSRERSLLLTSEAHLKMCAEAKKEIRQGIKEEFKDFRDYFDVEMENKVLKSLRNLNGTLEQKIADVVGAQVQILGAKLTDEINKKLDLVEVVKHLAKK